MTPKVISEKTLPAPCTSADEVDRSGEASNALAEQDFRRWSAVLLTETHIDRNMADIATVRIAPAAAP